MDLDQPGKEMMMRKIVIAEVVSLDGVIQAPGGVDEGTQRGFAHGGWTCGGKKLFPEGKRVNLRLLESRAFPSSVALIRYAAEQPA